MTRVISGVLLRETFQGQQRLPPSIWSVAPRASSLFCLEAVLKALDSSLDVHDSRSIMTISRIRSN
jgi:hypothetical protein